MKGVADPMPGWVRYIRTGTIIPRIPINNCAFWCIFPVFVQQFVYKVAIITDDPVRSLPYIKKLSPYQAPSQITLAPYVITDGAKDKDKDIM